MDFVWYILILYNTSWISKSKICSNPYGLPVRPNLLQPEPEYISPNHATQFLRRSIHVGLNRIWAQKHDFSLKNLQNPEFPKVSRTTLGTNTCSIELGPKAFCPQHFILTLWVKISSSKPLCRAWSPKEVARWICRHFQDFGSIQVTNCSKHLWVLRAWFLLNPKGNAIPMLRVSSKHEIPEPNHNFALMKLESLLGLKA